jgi:hypothetical protein
MAQIGKNIDSEGYDWDEDDQDRIGFMKECDYLEDNGLAPWREYCDDSSDHENNQYDCDDRYDSDDRYGSDDRDDYYPDQQPGTAPMIDLQKLALQKWACDEKTRLEEKKQQKIAAEEAERIRKIAAREKYLSKQKSVIKIETEETNTKENS